MEPRHFDSFDQFLENRRSGESNGLAVNENEVNPGPPAQETIKYWLSNFTPSSLIGDLKMAIQDMDLSDTKIKKLSSSFHSKIEKEFLGEGFEGSEEDASINEKEVTPGMPAQETIKYWLRTHTPASFVSDLKAAIRDMGLSNTKIKKLVSSFKSKIDKKLLGEGLGHSGNPLEENLRDFFKELGIKREEDLLNVKDKMGITFSDWIRNAMGASSEWLQYSFFASNRLYLISKGTMKVYKLYNTEPDMSRMDWSDVFQIVSDSMLIPVEG